MPDNLSKAFTAGSDYRLTAKDRRLPLAIPMNERLQVAVADSKAAVPLAANCDLQRHRALPLCGRARMGGFRLSPHSAPLPPLRVDSRHSSVNAQRRPVAESGLTASG
jgi:hypothetical protein